MSVIVLVEHDGGVIKKKNLEAVQYAAAIAEKTSTTATALVLGTISETELESLGEYGAKKVLYLSDSLLDNLQVKAFATALLTAAQKEGANIIIALNVITGKFIIKLLSLNLFSLLNLIRPIRKTQIIKGIFTLLLYI